MRINAVNNFVSYRGINNRKNINQQQNAVSIEGNNRSNTAKVAGALIIPALLSGYAMPQVHAYVPAQSSITEAYTPQMPIKEQILIEEGASHMEMDKDIYGNTVLTYESVDNNGLWAQNYTITEPWGTVHKYVTVEDGEEINDGIGYVKDANKADSFIFEGWRYNYDENGLITSKTNLFQGHDNDIENVTFEYLENGEIIQHTKEAPKPLMNAGACHQEMEQDEYGNTLVLFESVTNDSNPWAKFLTITDKEGKTHKYATVEQGKKIYNGIGYVKDAKEAGSFILEGWQFNYNEKGLIKSKHNENQTFYYEYPENGTVLVSTVK